MKKIILTTLTLVFVSSLNAFAADAGVGQGNATSNPGISGASTSAPGTSGAGTNPSGASRPDITAPGLNTGVGGPGANGGMGAPGVNGGVKP